MFLDDKETAISEGLSAIAGSLRAVLLVLLVKEVQQLLDGLGAVTLRVDGRLDARVLSLCSRVTFAIQGLRILRRKGLW